MMNDTYFYPGDLVAAVAKHPYYMKIHGEGLGIVVKTYNSPIGQTYWDDISKCVETRAVQICEVCWQADSEYFRTVEVPNYLLELVYRNKEIQYEIRNG